MLKNPFVISLIGKAANAVLKCIYLTCRTDITGLEHLESNQKIILILWHNRVTMLPQILLRNTKKQRFAAFVSNSRDGALLTALIGSYKRNTTIRVPHDLRHEALRKAIKQIRDTEDIVIITPDGPRGPRYEVKGGVALAAKGAKALVVPMSWKADRYWELKTWDRLIIPKPFSKLTIKFGAPISLAPGSLAEQSLELQQSLEALN